MRSIRSWRWSFVVVAMAVLAVLAPGTALGHAERDAAFPDGNGTTPTYRTDGPALLVCKADSNKLFDTLPVALRTRNERLHRQCMESGHRHIQAAVDAVEVPNSRILVLPGVYREEPSVRAHHEPTGDCTEFSGDGASNGDGRGTAGILEYSEQRACPHAQNLIGIFGDSDGDRECDLPICGVQIEGTGDDATDVIIEGGFDVLNGIRADRADGVGFVNLALQRFEFNALYILETDGFLIDRVLTRWNDEYGFLTFAVDHGLYERCEGYGNGDSAIYPGSASDVNSDKGHDDIERYAVEIRNCRGHHNALGYSGTAGNSVWNHDNEWDNNATGLITDSFFPNHPGLPQDHGFFQNNEIHGNNRNYHAYAQDGTCDGPFIERGYEQGIVCPVIPTVVGTGMLIAGGNWNKVEGNNVYDNWRRGFMQIWVPAPLREEMDPSKLYDTSNNNRYAGNRFGFGPNGWQQPQVHDFWWDDEGAGNCWQDNTSATGGITHNATAGLPDCDSGGSVFVPGNPVKQSLLAPCSEYNRDDNPNPAGCDWMTDQSPPEGRQPGTARLHRVAHGGAALRAAKLSREAFGGGSDAVVVTRAGSPADALVAAPLAGAVSGPNLVTHRRSLSKATRAEIERLGARRAYVVGYVSPAVRRGLRAAGVERITTYRGKSRYETAAAVATAMGGTEAYVVRANGNPSFADAFTVAALAAAQRRPILLSRSGSLPAPTRRTLSSMNVVHATLVGDTGKLDETVAKAVDERVAVVDRLDAEDRWTLTAAAADLSVQGIQDQTRLWIANGRSGIDPLLAAGAVAELGGVMLMAGRDSLDSSEPTREWLTAHARVLEDVHLVGGPRRLSSTTADEVREALE